jgi:serpin B
VANLAPRLRLFVSQARHAAVVRVDEVGTVAAAATGLGVRPASLPPDVSVDRPFVFAIVDDQSGAVLFLGTLVDPG